MGVHHKTHYEKYWKRSDTNTETVGVQLYHWNIAPLEKPLSQTDLRMSRLRLGLPTKLGSRQRDLSTLSVTKLANGHWHPIIASSCRWSQREHKRQQVHCINHAFAEEPSWWPGRSAVVQQLWRRDVTSPFPPTGNEGYIRNRDIPFQSVTPSHVGWPTKLGSLPKRHKSCPFQRPV